MESECLKGLQAIIRTSDFTLSQTLLKHLSKKSDMTWLLFKMITVVIIVKHIVGLGARAESGLGGYCKNIGKTWWLSTERRL